MAHYVPWYYQGPSEPMIQKWDRKIHGTGGCMETGKYGEWKVLSTEFTLWDEGEMAHYVP